MTDQVSPASQLIEKKSDRFATGLEPGECGSWIVDRETDEVYGHVTASNAFGDAYMVPINATLASMKEHLAATVAFLPSAQEVEVARCTASEIRGCLEHNLHQELMSNNKVATLDVRPLENPETSYRMGEHSILRKIEGPTDLNQMEDLMFPDEPNSLVSSSEMDDPTTPEQTENFINLKKSLYNLASNVNIDDITTLGPMSASEIAESALAFPDFLCHADYDKFHLFDNAAPENHAILPPGTNFLEPIMLQAKDKPIPEQLRKSLLDSGYCSATLTPDEDKWGIREGPKPVSLLGTQNDLLSMCEATQDQSEQPGPELLAIT